MSGSAVAGSSLLVRRLQESDLGQVIELLRASLGEAKVKKTEEFWRWKHEQSPFGPSPGLVAEADGRVVGVRVFLRWELVHGATTLRTIRPVDTATHPDWQGKGIFSRLTRDLLAAMQAEGVAFVFNTPNANSLPGYLKLGWVDLGRVDVRVRPRPRRLLRSLVGNAGGTRGHACLRPAAELLSDPGLGAFLERTSRLLAERGGFHTRLTPELFRWRYVLAPGYDYFGVSELSGDGGALIVGRLARRGRFQEAILSQVLASPCRNGTRSLVRLLRHVLRSGPQVDYVVAGPAAGPAESIALAATGFLPAPRCGLRLTARTLAAPVPSSLRGAWPSAIADLELL